MSYTRPLCTLNVITEYACSNGGVSDRHKRLDLYKAETHVNDIDPEVLDKAVFVVARNLGGQTIYNVQPFVEVPAQCIGYMAGGSFVTGDSRFSAEIQRVGGVRFYGAMALHDRIETTEQYRALSI
jgi:hypothetical protein